MAVKDKLKAKAGRRVKKPEAKAPKALKPRRKGINGREKGGRYENHVAKLFMKWTGEVLRRTPGSGGWSKGDAFGVGGDLVCTDKDFPFHIEAKNHQLWRMDDLITGVRSEGITSVRGWWEQTARECPEGKVPFLVFTNRSRAVKLPDFGMLWLEGYRPEFPHFTYYMEGLVHGNGEVVIFLLADFLKHEAPPATCKGHKAWKRGNHV
jgi:hypothetical protein